MRNINDINKRIKQRPPFQMIERVIDWTPGESATGIKNVCINEPYFMGHFPDAPIMPGVLIIEACAQLSSLVFDTDASNPDVIYVLLKVDNFKFVKPVIPGDTLEIEVTKTAGGAGLVKFDVKISVDGGLRAKGKLAFISMPKEAVYS